MIIIIIIIIIIKYHSHNPISSSCIIVIYHHISSSYIIVVDHHYMLYHHHHHVSSSYVIIIYHHISSYVIICHHHQPVFVHDFPVLNHQPHCSRTSHHLHIKVSQAQDSSGSLQILKMSGVGILLTFPTSQLDWFPGSCFIGRIQPHNPNITQLQP